jgi:hypothetical protein
MVKPAAPRPRPPGTGGLAGVKENKTMLQFLAFLMLSGLWPTYPAPNTLPILHNHPVPTGRVATR